MWVEGSDLYQQDIVNDPSKLTTSLLADFRDVLLFWHHTIEYGINFVPVREYLK